MSSDQKCDQLLDNKSRVAMVRWFGVFSYSIY